MTTSSETKQRSLRHLVSRVAWQWWLLGGSIVVIIVGTLLAVAYTAPGVRIVRSTDVLGIDVGGKTSLEAAQLLQGRWAQFSAAAYTFVSPSRTATIAVAQDSGSDDAVVLASVTFDPQAAANQALMFGRRGTWWQQARERLSGFLGRHHEMGAITIDQSAIQGQLQQQFHDLEQQPKNAGLTVDANNVATLVPSADGVTFDYVQLAQQAAAQARRLNAAAIHVNPKIVHPLVPGSDHLLSVANSQLPDLVHRAPFTLTYLERSWTISADKLRSLLGFTGTTAQPQLGFDAEKTTTYLKQLDKELDVKAQNAKFSVADGRVQEFQASAVGITLDTGATLAAMQSSLIEHRGTTAAIVVHEQQPLTDTVNTNTLGITELVATATTNFKGSPTNRRFNLTYGAQLLNGILIQPGEEFSLVKALGSIDQQHGWKPELVIKGNDIKPEFGGGLCQVATTMFRAALNAGLPISERHNHSLRIRYYEPPVGLDATIYEPQPDLRFVNDYSHPLLLQTNVTGNDLTFSLYGTKEGRVVDLPTPKVFNTTPIPATTYIETTQLKPGEQQCQTPGHPGADAVATYTVTYADGHTNKQTFTSHYRALGVICNVGKKPAPTTPAPTPTTPTTNTNTSVPSSDTNVPPETPTNA